MFIYPKENGVLFISNSDGGISISLNTRQVWNVTSVDKVNKLVTLERRSILVSLTYEMLDNYFHTGGVLI